MEERGAGAACLFFVSGMKQSGTLLVMGAQAAYTPSSDLRSWWALRGFLLQVFGTLTENATAPYTGDTFDYSANFIVSS